MQISEISEKTGLTSDTLRYYEKIGLIGPIEKQKSGIRNYTEEDFQRIQFVKCMRSAGVGVNSLKRYLSLYDKGDETIKERRDILIEQKEVLEKKINDMQEVYNRLVYKINLYDKKH